MTSGARSGHMSNPYGDSYVRAIEGCARECGCGTRSEVQSDDGGAKGCALVEGKCIPCLFRFRVPEYIRAVLRLITSVHREPRFGGAFTAPESNSVSSCPENHCTVSVRSEALRGSRSHGRVRRTKRCRDALECPTSATAAIKSCLASASECGAQKIGIRKNCVSSA